MFAHGDGVLFLGDIGGGQFGQHIHDEFLIGHIVTKVLFVEALEVLVFLGGKACLRLVDDVGEGGVTGAFFDGMDWMMRKMPSSGAQFTWCLLPSEEMNWWGVQIVPHTELSSASRWRMRLMYCFGSVLSVRASTASMMQK